MQEYVTEKFTGRLQEAIDRKADEGAEQMILAMGKAYVLFFVENPTYFTFLFSGDSIHAHLSLDQPDTDDYPLYLLMKKLYFRMNEENGRVCTKKEQELESLKKQLAEAVEKQEYETCAKLRDRVRELEG